MSTSLNVLPVMAKILSSINTKALLYISCVNWRSGLLVSTLSRYKRSSVIRSLFWSQKAFAFAGKYVVKMMTKRSRILMVHDYQQLLA